MTTPRYTVRYRAVDWKPEALISGLPRQRQVVTVPLVGQLGNQRRLVVELVQVGASLPQIAAAVVQHALVGTGGQAIWRTEEQLDPGSLELIAVP